MSLLKLMQSQIIFAKENTNVIVATKYLRPVLRNPMTQVIISFMVGYYATIKIQQICTFVRKQLDKKRPELEYATQLESDSERTQDRLSSDRDVLRLTREQLRAYNGLDATKPIYTALNGKIYDLSSSREILSQYPSIYSWVAGCNANDIISFAFNFMEVGNCDAVQRWEQSLEAEFSVVGYLVDGEAPGSDTETEVDDDMAVESRNERLKLNSPDH